MQTFLPHPSFARSARALDDRRLGKQRVEALQILRALQVEGYGWQQHPAVAMWRGHLEALLAYAVTVTRAWIARGHSDTVLERLYEMNRGAPPPTQAELKARGLLPAWLGWSPLHRSHQSALVRKAPAHYRPQFPSVPDDLLYVWPEPRAQQTRPFAAWVVRPQTPRAAAVFQADALVGLPATPEERAAFVRAGAVAPRTRHMRSLRPFVTEMALGHPVLAPIGPELLVGRIAGPASWPPRRLSGKLAVVRAVDWLTLRARTDLSAPFALDAPLLCFRLAGEAVLRELGLESI